MAKRKTMTGRPPKLTPATQTKIVEAVRAGNYFATACRLGGIGYTTGKEWLSRGEGKHSDRPAAPTYANFAAAVRQAEAESEVELVREWRESVKDKPSSIGEILARRFPERWSPTRRQVTELSGPGGAPIASDVTNHGDDITDQERKRKAAQALIALWSSGALQAEAESGATTDDSGGGV